MAENKGLSTQFRRPTTRRGKRYLEEHGPKLIENCKKALFVRGGNTSDIVTQCLKDLYQLKKPEAAFLRRRNPFRLFDDETVLESFCRKYDTSLFVFGSHSKKRPHNLIIGRMYDFHLLDMIEVGIENFVPIHEFKVPKCSLATKPCLLFSGEDFQQNPLLQRFMNLLTDLFRGPTVERLRLQGLEHVLHFTASQGKVHCRSYRIYLKKSGSRVPRIELGEMGPRFDMVVRRSKLASNDLYKLASRAPKQLKPKPQKNITRDEFGTQLARVHVGKQDLNQLQTRKMKGLKRVGSQRKRSHSPAIAVDDVPEKRIA